MSRVVHLALAYPSRHDLPEYRAYTAEVMSTAVAINDELGTPGWTPGASCTSRTTTPARWRRTGWPTSCSSTRSATA